MSHLTRTHLSLATLAGAVLFLASFAAQADDADAPLELGKEHLGMTSEGIAEVEQKAQTDQIVEEAIVESEWTDEEAVVKSEWSDQDLGYEPSPECPPVEAAAAGEPGTPAVETHAVGVDDYESCVEVAIRSGNGFKAASSVCQTLFPAPPAPPAPPGARDADLSASATTY